jgi:hypothetical protein
MYSRRFDKVVMNLEQAIEITSNLETMISKGHIYASNDGESAKYGTVPMYKKLVELVNFIDSSQSNDYSLRSLIKKVECIKHVLACELFKKFLLIDFSKDFYVNTEVLANVSIVYGNLYRTTLVNEFCKRAIEHIFLEQNLNSASHNIIKLNESFSRFVDGDKVDMFSDDWNISYYLYQEFRSIIYEIIKNLNNVTMKDIITIVNSVKDTEEHLFNVLVKKNSAFTIETSICTAFDENQYCVNLYITGIKSDIAKFKETLQINFNTKYNIGNDEYEPVYQTKLQPYTTAVDLFTFIRRIFNYTSRISSGKIFKMVCHEIFSLLTMYAAILNGQFGVEKEKDKSKKYSNTLEFILFNIITTSHYCMTTIDSMDDNLKLSKNSIPIEKIKTIYCNSLFLGTINTLCKETIVRIKEHAKILHAIKFEDKKDKKEAERVEYAKDGIDTYIENVIKIYGDTTHAFIGNAVIVLEEFCFLYVFKNITFQMLDCVIEDLLGLKNVSFKYGVYFEIILEKLMESTHGVLNYDENLLKYQHDIDTRLTKIKKIIDAISTDTSKYTQDEHIEIFGQSSNVSHDMIMNIKGQFNAVTLITSNVPNIPNMSNMPNMQTISNIPTQTMSHLTTNPVTTTVKSTVGKFGNIVQDVFAFQNLRNNKDKSTKL